MKKLVGAIGLEPTTPTMSRWCSNQLSYAPKVETEVYQRKVEPQRSFTACNSLPPEGAAAPADWQSQIRGPCLKWIQPPTFVHSVELSAPLGAAVLADWRRQIRGPCLQVLAHRLAASLVAWPARSLRLV